MRDPRNSIFSLHILVSRCSHPPAKFSVLPSQHEYFCKLGLLDVQPEVLRIGKRSPLFRQTTIFGRGEVNPDSAEDEPHVWEYGLSHCEELP